MATAIINYRYYSSAAEAAAQQKGIDHDRRRVCSVVVDAASEDLLQQAIADQKAKIEASIDDDGTLAFLP